VSIVWNETELAAMVRQDWVRHALQAYGKAIAQTAAADAPRRSGAGAASIHQETAVEDGGWAARVSWDKSRYYMSFQDLGTRYLPGRHFLEHALARYASR
jgi:HK97 gp10 family phage protein